MQKQSILTWALFIFIGGAVALWLIPTIIFNGGISGFINNLRPQPDPNSTALVESREASQISIDSNFFEIEAESNLIHFETGQHDICVRGESNWKRQDGYAHKCIIQTTKFYGVDGDFYQEMVELEQSLKRAGWQAPYGPAEKPITEMLDSYLQMRIAQYREEFTVAVLPEVDFTKGFNKKLAIKYADQRTGRDDLLIGGFQHASPYSFDVFYNRQDFRDVDAVINAITASHDYVVMIAIQDVYYSR